MTKQELIERLATDMRVTKRHAEMMINGLTKIIEGSVAKGKKVTITGFGTFDIAKRKKRRGVNPRTKESIIVPPMRIVHFRAGSRFKKLIRK